MTSQDVLFRPVVNNEDDDTEDSDLDLGDDEQMTPAPEEEFDEGLENPED